MEDFKLKFKLFINKQGLQHSWKSSTLSAATDDEARSSDSLTPSVKEVEQLTTMQAESVPSNKDEQLTDQDILKSIEDIYYSSTEFDPSRYELMRLPAVLACDGIQADLQRLHRQLNVVSSQVLQLILAQQPSCNDEFKRIEEIQSQLQCALELCHAGRAQLGLARCHFTTTSLGLLANYRKRQRALNLLHSLSTIKTLQRTEERLQELLREEDFAGAISLLLECQSAAATYRHFTCVAALAGKLQDTLLMAEESLDEALAKSCIQFSVVQYSKLQAAYELLGKTQIAADQLIMHFTSAVHNFSFSAVCKHASENISTTSKKSYTELCKLVPKDKFIICATELCQSLWCIVSCYREVSKWHATHPKVENQSNLSKSNSKMRVSMESAMTAQYVKQKLELGRARVWNDVQAKVAVLIMGCESQDFKFDEFLQVLDLIDRLVKVGEEFCDSGSKDLHAATRTQCLNYLRGYHLARMDELRMFLENEGWARCPVRSTFCALQLQEFRWAGVVTTMYRTHSSSRASTCSSDDGIFSRFPRSGSTTPFDLKQDDSPDEDFYSNDDDMQSEESEEEEDVDGQIRARGHHQPVLVANTTLSVLRLIGRYLRMMKLLQPIALDILRRLTQFVDLYIYAVHSFFARDVPGTRDNEYSHALQAALKRIHETLIQHEYQTPSQLGEIGSTETEILREKVLAPQLSPVVCLTDPDELNGLAERLVAVESLAFLAAQIAVLKPQIQALLPQDQWPALEHFYKQVAVAEELRKPVYMCVAWHALDLRQLLTQMSKVNWEVRDVMSQHSPYVDIILRELQIFSMRLTEISKRVPVPRDTRKLLWQLLSHLVCNTFVEGFANAKKCSNGGRGLMQLDFTQFTSKLERLAELRPIPGKEIVEQYIKAYYLPDTSLEAWMKEHSEYTGRQLIALVNCACQNNKKTRQYLLSVIEEMGR